jgi:hypothetical protein
VYVKPAITLALPKSTNLLIDQRDAENPVANAAIMKMIINCDIACMATTLT